MRMQAAQVGAGRVEANKGGRGAILAGVLLVAGTSAHAGPVSVWDFAISQPASGLNATVTNTASTSGTLIGNYTADANPTGTRTKPGLFGSFGDTENVAVTVNTLGASISGNVNTRTSGGYRLTIDTSANTIVMENFASNFLASGSASLPIGVSLSTASFRTRAPSSVFPGVPVTLPIGSATLSELSVAQAGPGAGTLTPTGPGTFDFTIATLVNLSASFDVLGNPISLPGALPLPFAITGSLVITGDSAVVTALTPIDFEQSQQPNQALPQFPLALPTLTGDPANVLLDLTLSNVGVDVAGTFTSVANGTLVPGPGMLGVIGVSGCLALRRRRPVRGGAVAV
jgi:hypothetical protein